MIGSTRTVSLLTVAIVGFLAQCAESSGILPRDVEMLDGYEAPHAAYDKRSRQFDADSDGFVKAVRNRRALYHIKTTPSEDATSGDGDGSKRTLEGNVDVSAQYTEQVAISKIDSRGKRDVIEETAVEAKTNDDGDGSQTKEWIPQPSPGDDDEAEKEEPAVFEESVADGKAGRGARGVAKDQWVKLPFVGREPDPPSASQAADEISRRLPRVNFVTQNKGGGLLTSESRNQRESIPRGSFSRSDLRTDIYPPGRDARGRSLDYSSSYSRQSYYYPDEYTSRRRGYYDDNGGADYYDDGMYYRRDPYYDPYYGRGSRRTDYYDYRGGRGGGGGGGGSIYDEYPDYQRHERPRRVIYYATLPDVVRSPPNVYRYPNSYRGYDDDRYYRDGRYYDKGYYYPRYPYSALKKAEPEHPRDLSSSSTSSGKQDKQDVKRQQQQDKKLDDRSRDGRDGSLNSHQYPIGLGANLNADKASQQTLYHDVTRMDGDYHRYDHPSFQAAVDDPYVSRHD